MVLLESLSLPMGSKALDFGPLPATDDNEYSLDSFKDAKILILIFMCNHCPYVKAIMERLVAIDNDYQDKGVQIVGINSNDPEEYPDDSFFNMKTFMDTYRAEFVYLQDLSQKTAKDYQAQCTPDIYVFNEARELAYHGRIDDNWKDPEAVTRNELREALDTILNGGTVEDQKPSMGCSIKWIQS